MELPLIIALPIIIIGFFFWLAWQIIKKDYRNFKKLTDELERQAEESERPHIEPLYRRRYKK